MVAGSGSKRSVVQSGLSYRGLDDVELRDEAGDGKALVGASSVMRYRCEEEFGGEAGSGAPRWAVGVYDKATGKVEFDVAASYRLVGTPLAREHEVEEKRDEDQSWLERNIALADAFGTKKKQKQLRARVANMVDASHVFAGDDLAGTVAGLAEAAAAAPAPAPASKTSDAGVDWEALLGDGALNAALTTQRAALEDMAREMRKETWVPVDWSAYVASRLAKLGPGDAEAKNRLQLLRHMLLFHALDGHGSMSVFKMKTDKQVPEVVTNHFLAAYALASQTDRPKVFKYNKPKNLKDKLLQHILLVMLKIDGGTADMDAVSKELNTPVKTLAARFKELGCTTETKKKRGASGPANTATLPKDAS